MARQVPLARTRNIGIMAHIDAGKTTTTERILFYTGVNYKLGEVHQGTATMDWMPRAGAGHHHRGGDDLLLARLPHQRIDTPGHVDFTVEVERSLGPRRCGRSSTRWRAWSQTETVWRQADRYHVPRIAFVNKMDRIGADFERCVSMMRSRLDASPVVMQLPWGREDSFVGVLDLVRMQGLLYRDETKGAGFEIVEMPAEHRERALEMREKMVEVIAETDDELLEKYLSGDEISEAELKGALRRATIANRLQPVFCGSAFKNKGVQPLLDAVVDYLPSPEDIPPVRGLDAVTERSVERAPSDDEPFAALIFKIMTDPFIGQLAYFGSTPGSSLRAPR